MRQRVASLQSVNRMTLESHVTLESEGASRFDCGDRINEGREE
ncbi:MAG TPA: hypothetical protein VGC89_12740 [Pyrinomonadaceae bacterium]